MENVFLKKSPLFHQADVLLNLGGSQMPTAGPVMGGIQLAPAGPGLSGPSQQLPTFPATLSMPSPMVPLSQPRPQSAMIAQQPSLTSVFATPMLAGTPSILTGPFFCRVTSCRDLARNEEFSEIAVINIFLQF